MQHHSVSGGAVSWDQLVARAVILRRCLLLAVLDVVHHSVTDARRQVAMLPYPHIAWCPCGGPCSCEAAMLDRGSEQAAVVGILAGEVVLRLVVIVFRSSPESSIRRARRAASLYARRTPPARPWAPYGPRTAHGAVGSPLSLRPVRSNEMAS